MLRSLRTVWPLSPVLAILLLSTGSAAGQSAAGQSAAPPDVRFMQGMIHHHAQAVRMSALVPDRSTDGRLHLIAERIDVSQRDEIALMEQWLERHGAEVPDVPMAPGEHAGTDEDVRGDGHGDGHEGHGDDRATDRADDRGDVHHGLTDDALMPGMLTPAQMAHLEEADGVAFDRLFLEYMIFHHEGALVMVDELLGSEGGGEAPEVFRFASDVAADQQAEIRRMGDLLGAISDE